jgi:hypothetical protein
MEKFYDFTRCVRPNGTAYGTSGQCRKGVEDENEMKAIDQLLSMLPKGEIVVDSSGKGHKRGKSSFSEEDLRRNTERLTRASKILEMSKASLSRAPDSEGFSSFRETAQKRVEKLESIFNELETRQKEINEALNTESQRSGIPRPNSNILYIY